MEMQHQELASGRWQKLSFAEQMANVGSEVGRALSWRAKNNQAYSRLAFERALELLDLTINSASGFPKLKELLRIREALADYFVFSNIYGATEQFWQEYFLAFNYAARLN